MKVDRQYGQRLKPRSQNPGVKHIVMDDVGEVTQITCADCGRVWAYSHDEILALPAASHANGDVSGGVLMLSYVVAFAIGGLIAVLYVEITDACS
jgi:hypothetical protein